MGIGMLINAIGALFAYLIGSGFASGQETVQYFSGWGWAGIIVGVITFFMMYLTYLSYAYVGRTRGISNLSGIYNFYAGKYVGKVFEAFAWLFNACCYVFMVSGFANVLYQQWGVSVPPGAAVAVIISAGTAILGLKRMVDVIGKIGPVIVIFTLIVGIISAFHYFPLISEGNALVASGAVEITRAGSNWLFSGLSFGGCSLLLVSAYVGMMGNDLREYKFKYTKIILCVCSFGIPFCSVIMGLNHIGNITEAASAAIPNLLLANNIFGAMGAIFAVIILAAIYSTLSPLMWTCVTMFIKDEKSLKYKLTCAVAGIAVWFVACNIPYQTLLNYIMTYCGYSGTVVFVVCVVRYFMIKKADKKEGVTVDTAKSVAEGAKAPLLRKKC